MKQFLLILALLAAPLLAQNTGNAPVTKKTGSNLINEDLVIGTGRTLAVSGGTLTSSGPLPGTALKLPFFRDKLGGIFGGVASTIVGVVDFGDSYAPLWASSTSALVWYKKLGFRGVWCGLASDFSLASYGTSGGVTQVTDFTANPIGYVYSVPSGGTVSFTVTDYDFNQGTVVYKNVTGGGTFKVQKCVPNVFGAAWTDVATVDTSAGTNGTLSTIAATLTLGRNQFRILGTSGTCIISGALLENTNNTSGLIFSRWSRGGLDLAGYANTIPQANLTTLLNLVKPDVVFVSFQDYDQATSLPVAWSLWSTARAAQSWAVMAPHLDLSLGSNRSRNDGIIAWTKANGQDYVDATAIIPDYATAVARGLMADTAHLNTQGFQEIATYAQALVNVFATTPSVTATSVTANTLTVNGEAFTAVRAGLIQGGFAHSGFISPAATQANVRNASALSSVGTGPFSIAAWVKFPPTATGFNSIFHTSSSGGGYQASNIALYIWSDGTLRMEFYQADTSTGWRLYIQPTEWQSVLGQTALVWLRRDASGNVSFGLNGSPLTLANPPLTIGSGVVSPAQTITANYVQFAGANNNNAANLTVYEAAFWSADVVPATWFTTGICPSGQAFYYKFQEQAGTLVRDQSGNGKTGQLTSDIQWTSATFNLTATAALDFPSIAAASSSDLTITVTGAVVGYSVGLGLPAAPTAGIVWSAFVSAADTVKVRATNITGSAIDPASATYRVTVSNP